MTEAYEGELEWLRSKVRELDGLQAEIARLRKIIEGYHAAELERLRDWAVVGTMHDRHR